MHVYIFSQQNTSHLTLSMWREEEFKFWESAPEVVISEHNTFEMATAA